MDHNAHNNKLISWLAAARNRNYGWLSAFLCVALCWGTCGLAAAAPHGISNVGVLDSRVCSEGGDAVSASFMLDTRALDGVIGWAESGIVGLNTGGLSALPVVQRIEPKIVPGLDGRQHINLIGTGFEPGSVVHLRTGSEFYVIPRERTQWVSSTEIRIFVNVSSAEADWTVQVVNAAGMGLRPLTFAVAAADVAPVGAVDFGRVAPGDTAERIYVVRNRGNSPVSLTVTVAAPFSITNGPFSQLAPGEQQQVVIQYSPQQVGAHERTALFVLGSKHLMRSVVGRSATALPVEAGTISGIVYHETATGSVPSPGAPVSLRDSRYSPDIFHIDGLTLTDANGRFSFEGLRPDTYSVTANTSRERRNRNFKATTEVTLAEGASETVELTLPISTLYTIKDPEFIPVVLVRGYGKAGNDEAGYWRTLRDYLRDEAGFKEVWDPNEDAVGTNVVINGEGGLLTNAIALRHYIGEQLDLYVAKYGYRPDELRIVAHSMGGLITRQFLHTYDTEIFENKTIPTIQEVIMLGTPHAGSPLADGETYLNVKERWDWTSTYELRPSTRQAWDVFWPNARGIHLMQIAGTTGNGCPDDTEDSDLKKGHHLIWVYYADQRGRFDETVNDGAVPVFSTQGKFRIRDFRWYGARWLTHDALNVAAGLTTHETMELNHSCIRKDNEVLKKIKGRLDTKGSRHEEFIPDFSVSMASLPDESTLAPLSLGIQQDVQELSEEAAPLAMTLHEEGSVSAGGAQVTDLLLDTTPSARLMLWQSSTKTVFRLEDPAGNLRYQSYPEISSNLLVEAFSMGDGMSFYMTIVDPLPGSWRILLDGTGSGEDTGFDVQAWVESPVVLFSPDNTEILLGAEAPLLAVLLDGAESITNNATVTADVRFPGGGTSNVVMQLGEDGRFSTLMAGIEESGEYEVIFRATGQHSSSDETYQRVSVSSLSVSSAGGFIVDVQGYTPIDTSDNGFADAIRVDVIVHVDAPGDYRLSGRLVDDTVDAAMHKSVDFSSAEGGSQKVNLLFTFHDLPVGAVYGPFLLRDLRLSAIGAKSVWIGSLDPELPIESQIYSRHTRSIRIVGDTDFGSVRLGTQVVHQVEIYNDGWSHLTVGELELPVGFSGTFTGTIPPSDSRVIDVTFAPQAEGIHAGSLVVVSDAEAGESQLGLYGIGLPVAITYDAWISGQSVQAGQTDPQLDISGDGLPNLFSYLFNVDPVAGVSVHDANARPKWTFSTSGAQPPLITLDYRLNRHAGNVTLEVDGSPTLIPLVWDRIIPESVVFIGLDPLTDDPLYRMSIDTHDKGRTNCFFRLRIFYDD